MAVRKPPAPPPIQGVMDVVPTPAVNSEITNSFVQSDTTVIGLSPAIATGNLYQSTAQALSTAAHNASNGQQQADLSWQAVTTAGVVNLYSVNTASTGRSTANILETAQTQ